jgi:hypothetical protein
VLYKICKKGISHARAPHGRDVWGALIILIHIKSDWWARGIYHGIHMHDREGTAVTHTCLKIHEMRFSEF